MKKKQFFSDQMILLFLAGLKFGIHLLVNLKGGYGLFRDEFYYLACANFPDWGYVDHPPLSILILQVWRFIFGDSLFSIRFLPALSGALIVFLTGFIVREIGGKRFAQLLAAVAMIVAPAHLALHGFYSMNAFDHLVWTVLIYIFIKIIKTGDAKLWLLFGGVAGLGLQNKLSVLFLAFGLAIGILLTRHRRWLLNKFTWCGVGLAGLLLLPHIIWQIQHNWPTREFIAYAAQYKNVHLSPMPFFLEQVINLNPATALIWLGGLVYLLLNKKLQPFRLFAFAYSALFVLFVLLGAKPYYLLPIYPILFAAGALLFENLFSRRHLAWLKPITVVLLFAGGLFLAPFALPVLPIDSYISYADKTGFSPQAEENHEMGVLPQHFADMFGWREMVAEIAGIYQTLPDSDKAVAAVYVQNYGQAGAIDYYRSLYHLPPPLCGHNNYYLWGTRGQSGDVLIIYGGRRSEHEQVFNSVQEAARFQHPYVMPYENNQPIYICRGLKMPINQVWSRTKHFG